ncbi:hypothetical protein Btru_073826 [Bulinus truncatus]|nr:hypothetical protein Btru_073826 [Bulinus truncatus]
MEPKVHLSFGILTDIQFADCEDGMDYTHTRRRYYRNALKQAKEAITQMTSCQHPVYFILQLGDMIDTVTAMDGEDHSKMALNHVLDTLTSAHVPVYHVIGNHDLQCLTRAFYLTSLLNNNPGLFEDSTPPRLYYTFLPHPKLRIVALDTLEVSLLGYEDRPDDVHFKTAQTMLRLNNPNEDGRNINGLTGVNQRWASYNGGVSQQQLQWLSDILDKSDACEENVIIISHVPVLTNDAQYLAWNYDEIIDVIGQYQCVIGVFTGHRHDGGSVQDGHTHHVTFQGIIETPPGVDAFAVARLLDESVEVKGAGRIPCYSLKLRYPIQ